MLVHSHTFILLGAVEPEPCSQEACPWPLAYAQASPSVWEILSQLPAFWNPYSSCRVSAQMPAPLKAFPRSPLTLLETYGAPFNK